MGESEDYMSPEYQPDPFKKVYWNMIQTLLWIRYGEASSDDIRETDDSLFLDAGPEEGPSAILYFLDYESKYALEETEEVLLRSLQRGEIKGYGAPNGERGHEEIPVSAWADLELFPDESLAGSLKLSDVITWREVKFKVEEILNTFHAAADQIIQENDWGSDWSEIYIIITSQANLLLENKKTGKVETIHPSALGLCPKRSGTPNKKFKILGKMHNNKPVKIDNETTPIISRLRKSLKAYFSIDSDPFYINNSRYYPVFNIESQEKNQDSRLEKAPEMYGGHKSFDQLTDPEIARIIEEQKKDEIGTRYISVDDDDVDD